MALCNVPMNCFEKFSESVPTEIVSETPVATFVVGCISFVSTPFVVAMADCNVPMNCFEKFSESVSVEIGTPVSSAGCISFVVDSTSFVVEMADSNRLISWSEVSSGTTSLTAGPASTVAGAATGAATGAFLIAVCNISTICFDIFSERGPTESVDAGAGVADTGVADDIALLNESVILLDKAIGFGVSSPPLYFLFLSCNKNSKYFMYIEYIHK